MPTLSEEQCREFHRLGYTVIRDACPADLLSRLADLSEQELLRHVKPLELEADVSYPGSPPSVEAPGGRTERRLLRALDRDSAFYDWATGEPIASAVRQLLETDEIYLNPNHHNCIMTKQPEYSSDTLWHRDTRYWNFSSDRLINAWLALGREYPENGAMQVLPGSHRWVLDSDDLDDDQFLLPDTEQNQARIASAVTVNLEAGDLLLFSANMFHAADRNATDTVKYSLVFTYHGPESRPTRGSRSSELPEISVP